MATAKQLKAIRKKAKIGEFHPNAKKRTRARSVKKPSRSSSAKSKSPWSHSW